MRQVLVKVETSVAIFWINYQTVLLSVTYSPLGRHGFSVWSFGIGPMFWINCHTVL